jgi:hypothetical protein
MRRGPGIALAFLSAAFAAAAFAQPGLRPAPVEFPSQEALTGSALWDAPEFLAGWSGTAVDSGEEHRAYRGRCQIFGHQAQSVTGLFEGGRLTGITIVVLDAGAWFGFVPDSQAKKVAAAKGPEFAALYKRTAADVERGLAGLAGGAGRKVQFIEKGLLRQDVLLFHPGDLWVRLTVRENQLVKLTATRLQEDATSPLSAMRRTARKDEQILQFAGRVRSAVNGDRAIEGLPIFVQGDRAYCGIATLAMAMQYLGLRLDTEDYAGPAGIRFGSTYHSTIKGAYEAAAEAAKVRLPRTTQFDFERARMSIDAGYPVVVFRRWSQERDFLHGAFAQRLLNDPAALLPKPDLNDRKNWPTKDDFAHSSIITGYNAPRREVIFTESWGEAARNRRMRIEEMEGTVYMAYYPRL